MKICEAVTIRLRQLLQEKHMTQYQLEKRSCVSHDTVKSIVKSKTKGVTLRTLVNLAEGLDMTVSEFLDSDLFDYANLEID